MGLSHSPSLATNGLLLAVDAANPRSYPGSGTTWNDLSGNAHNGTLTNGPTYSSGNGGHIVHTGASNHHTAIANTTALRLTTSVTLQAMIYPTSYPSGGGGGGFIVAMPGAYYLELKNSGVLRTYFYGLSNAGYHDGTNTVPLNQWSHVSVVRDQSANTIVTYINGVVDRTISSITGSMTTAVNTLQIGAFSGGGYSFNGRIANAHVYNRALSATEILQNFTAMRGRFGL